MKHRVKVKIITGLWAAILVGTFQNCSGQFGRSSAGVLANSPSSQNSGDSDGSQNGGSLPTPTPNPTASPSPTPQQSSTCPRGNSSPDGCNNAPAGTPQHPSLLTLYPTRPSWNVAGVDYYVGLPYGTSLLDPTTSALPPGCSYSASSHTVTCSQAGVVIENYDFSLHGGVELYCDFAANITVKNNNFGMSGNSLDTIVGRGCDNFYVGYNTIDQGGVEGVFTAAISVDGGSGLTVEYNWIKNCGSDAISSTNGTVVTRYNMVENLGQFNSSAHPDFHQQTQNAPTTILEYYNTWYNPASSLLKAGAQGDIVGQNTGVNFTGAGTFDHNTMIANGEGSQITVSYWVGVVCANFEPGATQNVSDNYADITNAYGFAYSGTNTGCATYSNNTNLVTNTLFGNNP